MTQVSVEEFRADPDQYLAETAKGDVIVTQNGEPWLVLRSVDDDQDRISRAYADSPEFRQTIGQRRLEQSIPWDQARQQLEAE